MTPALKIIVLSPRRLIAAGKVAEHRKGLGITQTGGLVSAWADQTGLGHSLLNAAADSFKPTVSASGTIIFDGATQFLQSAAYTRDQPRTTYLRFRQLSWTLNDVIIAGRTINTLALVQSATTPGLTPYAGTLGTVNNAAPVGEWVSCAIVWNNASSSIRVGATKVSSTFGATSGSGITLGANGNQGQCAHIEVAAVVDYDGAHTDTQQDWNISVLDRV